MVWPPWKAVLVCGDEGKRRCERHLEPRMHDGLWRQQQNDNRRHRERAESQCRTIEHNADKDNRDHDVGALGRHLGAREQQIKGRRQERSRCSPLLDRPSMSERRDQCQNCADHEKHDPRDNRHVIAGDRQNVRKARDVHRIIDRRRYRIAFARDQRRGNGPSISGQRRTDAIVDRLAYSVDGGCVSQPKPCGRRRRLDPDGPERIAGGADFLKIHIASKVVAAGSERLHGRRQVRLELNKAADWRRAALAHRDAHPMRYRRRTKRIEPLNTDHDAVASLPLFANLHKPGKCGACDRKLQDRMSNTRGLQRCNREPGKQTR